MIRVNKPYVSILTGSTVIEPGDYAEDHPLIAVVIDGLLEAGFGERLSDVGENAKPDDAEPEDETPRPSRSGRRKDK